MEYIKNSIIYKINKQDNFLIIAVNERNYKIKVINTKNDYVYKFNKKSITAKNGIDGLIKFIDKILKNEFCSCWLDLIIKHTIEHGEIE